MRRTLLGVLIAVLASAPPALAAAEYRATYTFPSSDLGGWSGQVSPGFAGCAGTLATWCPYAGSIHAHAAARQALAAGSGANLLFTTPPSVGIRSAELTVRYRTVHPSLHVRLLTSTQLVGSTFAAAQQPDADAAATKVLHAAGDALRRVGVSLVATDPVAVAGIGSADQNTVDVLAARIALYDTSPPSVSLAGAPSSSAWYRGRVCVRANATDPGLGVYGVRGLVAGRSIAVLAPATGHSTAPRPAAFTGDLCFDTATFDDGYLSAIVWASDGVDAAGNQSAPAMFDLHADNHAPALSIGAPASTEERRPALAFHAADPTSGLATITATLDGEPLSLVGGDAGAWSADPGVLGYGRHTVHAVATDAAGNASELAQAMDVVDRTPPTVSAFAPAAGATAPAGATISAAVADSGSGIRAESLRASLDGHDIEASGDLAGGTFRYQPRAALAPGHHDVRIAVADAVGNTAQGTWSFNVRAPAVNPSRPPPAAALALRFRERPATISGLRRTTLHIVVRRGSTLVRGARVHFAWLRGRALGSAVSDGHGVARVVLSGARGGTIVATAGAARTTLAVRIRPELTLVAARSTVRAGSTATIRGRIAPRRAIGIVIEAYANHAWVGVKAVRSGSDGRFTVRLPLRRRNLYILRATIGTMWSRAVQVWAR